MFKDRVYEEMDDLSKMIEPYQYAANDEISKFPNEIELRPEEIDSTWGISVRDIVRSRAAELGLKELLSQNSCYPQDFFEFKIVDEFGEEVDSTEFNFKENTLSNKIIMYKKKIAYEDKDLEQMVKSSFEANMCNFNRYSELNASRLNEIADLFNANEVMKERSIRKKIYKLKQQFRNLFDTKKLDIRDVGLAERLAKWILLYGKEGNLAALNNITRLKIMTHQNKPIYSIEEKETR